MTDELPLAAEFPAATREDWLKLVRAALKDRPFERLIAKTYDGHRDRAALSARAGRAADRRAPGPWQVMARVDHPDPAAANARRCTNWRTARPGSTLVFAGAVGAYGYGLPSDRRSGRASALDGVHLDAIAIELQTAEPTKDAARSRRRAGEGTRARARRRQHPLRPRRDRRAHLDRRRLPIPCRDLMPRFGGHVAALAKLGFKRPARRRRRADRSQRRRLGGAGARLHARGRGRLSARAGGRRHLRSMTRAA